MLREIFKQDLAKFWLVFSWKGLKIQDRLKLWITELAAFMLMGTIENKLAAVSFAVFAFMFWWTKKTINMKDLDDLMKKLDDDEYGK